MTDALDAWHEDHAGRCNECHVLCIVTCPPGILVTNRFTSSMYSAAVSMASQQRFIQGGTYAGSGIYFVGTEDRDGSPLECTVEITDNSARFLVSGYFRRPTDTAKRRFSGSFSTLRHALTRLTIDAIESRVAEPALTCQYPFFLC